MTEVLCFHVYTGGSDGGVSGVRCNKPERLHCTETHYPDYDRSGCSEHHVHHAFQREPLTGVWQISKGKVRREIVVINGIVTKAPQTWMVGEPWLKCRNSVRKYGWQDRRLMTVKENA